MRKTFDIELKNSSLPLGQETKIMGILNLSPDSFSHDGFRMSSQSDYAVMLRYSQKLVRDGADILDVGGESTRPGSQRILIQEEIRRIIPAIKILSSKIKIPISVDTYKTTVARHALDHGVAIVNNVFGTHAEKSFLKMVARYNATIVLMHIRGIPRTMQKKIRYKNFFKDVLDELSFAVKRALDCGIHFNKIIIDPGIGFGKTVEQNLELINRVAEFRALNRPILVGPSRKSFIGHVLVSPGPKTVNRKLIPSRKAKSQPVPRLAINTNVHERLLGTLASVCACIQRGAHIVRVHDVKAVRQTCKMMDAILYSAGQKK